MLYETHEPREVSYAVDKLRAQEVFSPYEHFGVRGLTWFLPYLKETIASPEFQNRVQEFKQQPTAENIAALLAWGREIDGLCASLLALSRATEPWPEELTGSLSPQLLYAQQIEELRGNWNTCITFIRNHQQVASFAKVVGKQEVPLEKMYSAYRNHLLVLFGHDIKGSRTFSPLINALDLLQEYIEEGIEPQIASIASRSLDDIAVMLNRHEFDTHIEPPLTLKQLTDSIAPLVAKLESTFGLTCKFEQKISGALDTEVLSLSPEILDSILDNCTTNARNVGATELTITLDRNTDHLHLVIRDNGKGFSAKHTFISQREEVPGVVVQAITIKRGNSISDTPGAVGTGIGLAELKAYMDDIGGSLTAGNYIENGMAHGGVVVFTMKITALDNS